MTLIDKAEAHDDDLIRRVDALEKHIEDTARDTHKLLVAAEKKLRDTEGALQGLLECCEVMRDAAAFLKHAHAHQVSATTWQAWCKQIRITRAALAPTDAAHAREVALREAASVVLNDFDALLKVAGKATEAHNSGLSLTEGVRQGLRSLIGEART